MTRFVTAGVTYEIPSDYAHGVDGEAQPRIVATYPQFRPHTEADGCEDWFVSYQHHRCSTFDFLVGGGGHRLNRRQGAENLEKGFPEELKVRSLDEYGFHTWHLKGGEKEINFTREDGGKFYEFFCSMNKDAIGNTDGVCDDTLPLSDGNSVLLFFPYHMRGQLPAIEAGIDDLMKRFKTN